MAYASRASRNAPSPAETITAAIIERLEAGTRPWAKPWTGSRVDRPLRACGIPYRGINTFWLWLVADARGYASPHWMTYRQAMELGGQVRRGEKSTIAVFYKSYTKESPSGEDEQRRVLRSYPVFNADQVDGLPATYRPADRTALPVQPAFERDAELRTFFDRLPAQVSHGGDHAYYDINRDSIRMPDPERFLTRELYWATRAHEAAHWTGHKSRLDRQFGKRFGDRAYAVEELCAELASATLGAELGLPVSHLDDHAAYIASWISVLRSDSRAILSVASKAEEAAGYLLRLGGRGTIEDEDADADENSDPNPLPMAA